MKGRVYRTCSCRDDAGKQLGARCPDLAGSSRHGAWSFAVDLPALAGRRKTMRRRGFATKAAAQRALDDVLVRQGAGVQVDDRENVAAYLHEWMAGMDRKLKAKTSLGYRCYIDNDLVPALGAVRLERLTHRHVAQLIADMEAAGRGGPTIRRCVAVLSSALADAVERRRLPHNVARYAPLPPEGREERRPWTVEQASRFLAHVADHELGPLFEVLIGCGLRRGEALGLRWADVDLEGRVLQVRQTLSDVNGRLMFTKPKTPGSAAGVGMSSRVVEALRRQRAVQDVVRAQWAEAYDAERLDLVFARADGSPLRPERVLWQFHERADEAGLPRCTLHDLRHLAATLMLASGVPLAVVSKMLRHSKISITVDLYGHLSRETSTAAADMYGAVLDAAAAELAAERAVAAATTVRPHDGHGDHLTGAVTDIAAGQRDGSGPYREPHPLELLEVRVARLGQRPAQRAEQVDVTERGVGRAEQHRLEVLVTERVALHGRARKGGVGRGRRPVGPAPGRVGGGSELVAEHHRIGSARHGLGEVAGAEDASVGDDVDITAAGLVEVVAAGGGGVDDRGGHGHADAQHLVGGGGTGLAVAHDHPGRAGPHEVHRSAVVTHPAGDDGDVEGVDEVLQVQRLPARHVLGGDDRALDHEDLDAGSQEGGCQLAGPLGADAGGDRHPGVPHGLQRLGEQGGVDRRGVQFLQEAACGIRVTAVLRVVHGLDHPGERTRGVGVAGPQSFGVEHAQTAEPPDPDGALRGDDRVGRMGDERDLEPVGVELPGRRDVLRTARPTGRHDLDLIQVVAATGLPAHPDLHEVTHGGPP